MHEKIDTIIDFVSHDECGDGCREGAYDLF